MFYKMPAVIVLALAAAIPVFAKDFGLPDSLAGFSLTESDRIQLHPGLVFYSLSHSSGNDQYVLSGPLTSMQDASHQMVQVNAVLDTNKDSVFEAEVENAGAIGKDNFDVGYRLVVSGFANPVVAQQVLHDLGEHANKFTIHHHSSFPGTPANQQLSVLEVIPEKFRGSVQMKLAKDQVEGVEVVSEMVARTSAVAGVNGGFFVYKKALGVIGDPAGLAIINGQLISEAVAHRPALLIQQEPQLRFEVLPDVTTQLRLQAEGRSLPVNGINREPGKVFNCGFYKEASLVSSAHDTVCHSLDEIVVLTSDYGQLPDLSPLAAMAYIDHAGQIKPVSTFEKKALPEKHLLVIATGDKRQALTRFTASSDSATMEFEVFSNGELVTIDAGTSLINGGPTLLLNGAKPVDLWQQEGWSPLHAEGVLSQDEKDDIASDPVARGKRAVFFDGWVNKRHPRTAVGIAPDGTAYFVVAYGRDPTKSAGLTIYEMAQVLSDLGAVRAINLDGGGSSVMIVNGKATGMPSDRSGERAVADALLVLPPSED
ncbi:phosphodiester glycosidase family protein [Alteromonas pelagimontana]|uniref:Phosphodiester glycosidase family protein n=1 Tax=Alteromonas pelagimontana TaxID=1858656 RepID=A0A6M4MEU2_9ALTE|nr:phosphodiester glycosidase family protein [Alteromonas pelagimontana]QJR81701.1 phosphodiester glycosidase family protein [Alteromonas pelagimontana]